MIMSVCTDETSEEIWIVLLIPSTAMNWDCFASLKTVLKNHSFTTVIDHELQGSNLQGPSDHGYTDPIISSNNVLEQFEL